MHRFLAILITGTLAACSDIRPSPLVSPQLDSGVTSSNGGGTRTLGNNPNVGVSTRVGPTR